MAGHVIRQLTWAHLPTHLGDAIRTNSGPRYLGALLLPALVHRTEICAALCQTLWHSPDEHPDVVQESLTSRGPLNWGKLLRLPAKAGTLPAERRAAVRTVGDIPRWLRNYRIAGLSPAALERLLRRCRAEGVGVVLLAPPASSAHRAQYTPAIESAFQDYLKGIGQQFGCAFIDARNWVPDELFVDCHHLDSETGSPYFTRLLTHRVLVPLLDRPGTALNQPRPIRRAHFHKDSLQ
jgi:hypothetical protein